MIYTSNILLAATSSGSGKTTVTLGLLRALSNRGQYVQPFKCGPDYIDVKFHNQAAKRQSVNLDLFLSSNDHIEYLYSKYTSEANVSVIEGVMGLFDGYDKMQGSSAQIAEVLDIPVILIINAKSTAYSVAAMIYGFKNFYPLIDIKGVIFNFVASESHYSFLKDACDSVGIESLGYLPKQADLEIPSRHLGLSIDGKYRLDEYFDSVAALIEKHIDIDRLLELTCQPKREKPSGSMNLSTEKLEIAVAYDKAFNFVYHENLESLKRIGNVTFFSPLADNSLPNADLVYFPGGYPELYLKELSENTAMHNAIRQYAESGGKLLAECGGMMYLSSSIVDVDGTKYPMVNIFEQDATMENMKLKLGYRYFEYNNKHFRGHEFHYSTIQSNLDSETVQYGAKKQEVDTKLLRYKNTIAGYTHLYWADNDIIMNLFE